MGLILFWIFFRLLYFRTGVSSEDLTGKTWRQVGAPTQMSRAGSVTSLFSNAGGTVTPRDKRYRSWTSLVSILHNGVGEGRGKNFPKEGKN